MARTKNNFLNAKPVSKMGGGSGGVRKPNKPYTKPPAKPKAEKPARWDAKTKTERLQDAAKTKPKSPAPKQVIKKPVTRTGPVKGPVPPKGSSPVTMPNSRRAGVNLPQTGARAERTATRVADLKKASTPKPNASAGTSAAVRGAAAGGARGLVRGAGKLLGRVALPAAIAQQAKDVLNPKDNIISRGAALGRSIERVVGGGGGGNATPAQRAAKLKAQQNAKPSKPTLSSTGVRVSDKQNKRDYKAAPTGSQQYNDYRNRQIANNRTRLQGVGNPPKPTPPAPRQQPPAASTPAARPSASRPSQTRPSRTTATATGSQQARPAEKQPSMGREAFDRSGKGSLGPNYGIDQFGDKNGIDMERRRALLDAKDSQEGRKAINKLMEERRKKQRENDSTSK